MSTRIHRTLLAAMIGSTLAFGAATPAFAREHGHAADQKQQEEQQARGKGKAQAQARADKAAQAEAVRTRGADQRAAAQARGDVRAAQARRDAEARQHAALEQRANARALERARIGQEQAAASHARNEQRARQQAAARQRTDRAQAREAELRLNREADRRAARQRAEARATAERRAEQRAAVERRAETRQLAAMAPRPAVQTTRLPVVRQRELIERQQVQASAYQRYLLERQTLAQRRAWDLERANRLAQYRYQQAYYERLREQQQRLSAMRSYDYYNDPYFYTPASYRYGYGGNSYQTNRYGADLLRQAVNYGYQEGVRAGRADRMDGWRPNYRDSFAYQDANYGYNGRYLSRYDYNHYFRQGFQRGYNDGYYSQSQYGRYNYNAGSGSMLETILSLILNLQPLG